MMASIASRWSGRNVEKPHTRWSVSVSASDKSGFPRIPGVDVVVDELLEFARELVVRAAQRFHVLAVNIDGTVRRLARAGQADADVRGLRLAGSVDDAAHDRQRHRLDALVRRLPLRHLVADVALDLLGELLERAARRAPAAGTRGDAGRKRSEAERLQQLARGVHLFASIAARPRRQRDADRVADALVQQDRKSVV